MVYNYNNTFGLSLVSALCNAVDQSERVDDLSDHYI